MKPSEFIREIKKKGFRLSHHGTNHDFWSDGERVVMVERHNKEISKKTLDKMMKDAGLK